MLSRDAIDKVLDALNDVIDSMPGQVEMEAGDVTVAVERVSRQSALLHVKRGRATDWIRITAKREV